MLGYDFELDSTRGFKILTIFITSLQKHGWQTIFVKNMVLFHELQAKPFKIEFPVIQSFSFENVFKD